MKGLRAGLHSHTDGSDSSANARYRSVHEFAELLERSRVPDLALDDPETCDEDPEDEDVIYTRDCEAGRVPEAWPPGSLKARHG